MYLFFDWVSSKWYIWLFDNEKKIICSESFEVQWNESTKIIPLIDIFLKKNNTLYKDIENIAVVIGPGSFTWIRAISLIVNTLSYTHSHMRLTGISFFDLYNDFPIVKSSSKRDLFVKYSDSATIEIVKNEDFFIWEWKSLVYWDVDISKLTWKLELFNEPDYNNIFKNLELQENKIVAPLYIKKPNIS